MLPSPVDLLAFGPHPDDVEIGAGATLVLQASKGARVGVCDLTRGERGSNGTPEQRVAEAEAARDVLGAAWRVNLSLPDGALAAVPDQVAEVVGVIRRARPAVVLVPYGQDRHPDHMAAHVLLARAIFDAGLRRHPAPGDPWRTPRVCSYFINDTGTPSFVLDVSAVYTRKRDALACYGSQFRADAAGSVETRLTSPIFMQLVESRDAAFGAQAGVRWAEGFVAREILRYGDLFAALPASGPP